MNFDTIAAIATPPGEGGIAIIRISGPSALNIAARVFQPRAGEVTRFAGYSVHYGNVVDCDPESQVPHVVDDGVITVFRAPQSYTGEDVCEIACHGGSATTSVV